jgi:hypothetical protein
MGWIVSDSFPHLLHSSSVCGCFKFIIIIIIMDTENGMQTWSYGEASER